MKLDRDYRFLQTVLGLCAGCGRFLEINFKSRLCLACAKLANEAEQSMKTPTVEEGTRKLRDLQLDKHGRVKMTTYAESVDGFYAMLLARLRNRS